MCQIYGGNVYLSGSGGRDYLDLTPFKEMGIEVRFQDYHHPTYKQCFDGFLPYMSALDALFCIGKMPVSENSLEKAAGTENLEISKEALIPAKN